MSATRFSDRTRARKQRPCSHLGFSPNAYVCESDNAENQGPFFAPVQQEFPHLKKRYWGQHIWARGYFCTTVGQVTDEMIRDYIAGHVGKSPDDSFTVD